jgi:hypothetical protein
VLAAADRMPSRVMRTNPRQLGSVDWSELALAGLLQDVGGTLWALWCGLLRQGFGQDLLKTLTIAAKERPPPWISRLIETAPPAGPGVLVILRASRSNK